MSFSWKRIHQYGLIIETMNKKNLECLESDAKVTSTENVYEINNETEEERCLEAYSEPTRTSA